MTDERAFPPWSGNSAIRFFLYDLNAPIYFLPLLVAIGYWLIPLLFSTWDDTLACKERAQAAVQYLDGVGLPTNLIEAAERYATSQRLECTNSESLPYLQDTTHFLFTLTLSIGVLAGLYNVKYFNRTVAALFGDGVILAKKSYVSRLYQSYRREAFKAKYVVVCAVFGILAGVLFLHLHHSPQLAFWWGSEKYGSAGLVFSVAVGAMVFSVLWGSVILIFGSLMLARIMRLPVRLRPFHHDGCNGLAPLGRQIFLLWWVAAAGGLAIFITLQFGYLGVQKNPIIWLLAALGTLAIPAIAIIPLYASLQAVRKVQSASLRCLGRLLNDKINTADAAVRNGKASTARNILSEMGHVQGIFDIYKETNVWPFNTRALTIIVGATLLQFALTFHEIYSLFKGD
jgi:hypothetical protein